MSQDFVEALSQRIAGLGLVIEGPTETEYGAYWPPTVTYWVGNRRVHFYAKLSEPYDFVVEVVAVKEEQRVVHETNLGSPVGVWDKILEDVWDIILAFLYQWESVDEMYRFGWDPTGPFLDDSIPHPPNKRRL